jgi:glutamyl-Q tRNA(Asp) synthetase
MTFRTRFAPSPTGPLHLGHAYSALLAHDMARAAGGQFLLRIDDIDQSRARPEWEAQIIEDLTWLGVTWEEPVWRQSDHPPDYRVALDDLAARGLTYPCHCTRRDIREAASAPQEGATHGPDGIVYPGTCRGRQMAEAGPNDAIRLDMARAVETVAHLPTLIETGDRHHGKFMLTKTALIQKVGDVVLARPGMGASYHLSVVVDDAAQRITHVIRGEDLFEAAILQAFLAKLLGYAPPIYHHHRLIRDETGKRLAKRDDARAIRTFREDGYSPDAIRRLVGLHPART